jgi:hypothetical protein
MGSVSMAELGMKFWHLCAKNEIREDSIACLFLLLHRPRSP